ncbi:hypothetical protein GON03_02545 [Nocardioides sp. MAH-18]|uniref:DUF4440 domain-containing protein n=1 Tax=Nocardioides agri TaxID=2682843 RepID=A0A6L6XMT0_9ACTN|nr:MULTISPECIES: hypothetical protein [unclassified Nocardioides]MBA2953174.1 hypothetical protein [Nocardioides sp. CGMCC 1.13656]MVQ48043.1 hypothetical protein [Nocardioides sp. MAH-18]
MLLAHVLLPLVLALLPQPRPEVSAAAVLHDWDDRRAAAWAAVDAAALRSLYVPGSAAGRADVRLLRQWGARGSRVREMQMQLRCVAVLPARHGRLVLVVTDRVVGAGADRPSTWRLALRRVGEEWRMAQVSPARTTSCTVRSRNE